MDDLKRTQVIRDERLRCMMSVSEYARTNPILLQKIWELGMYRKQNGITLAQLSPLTDIEKNSLGMGES